MNTTECIGCGICDGTGVIAVTDIPESRVLVCPAWPADQDEPLAYYWAVEGLGYAGPATMQQRIRDNVMAEVQRTKQAPTSDQRVTQSGIARGFLIALAVCIPVWIGAIAFVGWYL